VLTKIIVLGRARYSYMEHKIKPLKLFDRRTLAGGALVKALRSISNRESIFHLFIHNYFFIKSGPPSFQIESRHSERVTPCKSDISTKRLILVKKCHKLALQMELTGACLASICTEHGVQRGAVWARSERLVYADQVHLGHPDPVPTV